MCVNYIRSAYGDTESLRVCVQKGETLQREFLAFKSLSFLATAELGFIWQAFCLAVASGRMLADSTPRHWATSLTTRLLHGQHVQKTHRTYTLESFEPKQKVNKETKKNSEILCTHSLCVQEEARKHAEDSLPRLLSSAGKAVQNREREQRLPQL